MSVTNPLKGRSEYRYNTQGSLVSHTLPNGAVINYRYDREGKITQKSNALGDSSYLLYDTQKRVQASINAHQSKTEYFYDKTDRIIKTKDGINNEIHYQYNTQARLYRITDPVGNDTKYFYDNAGRLEQELSPSKELSVRSYNPDNTLNSITRRDNSEIVFTYNALRVPSEILYTATDSRTQKTQTLRELFGYDKTGRVTQASNAHSLVRLGYNRIGKINQEQQFFKAFTIQKTSDAKTHTDTLSFAGTTVQITHDFTTRTKTLTKNNRYPITIHYDTQGIEHTLVYPNGLKEQYTFNKAHQITALETANQRLSYQYDKVGNIIQKSHIRYTYDAIGRLTGVNQHAFTYDKAGNNQNDYARYDQTTYQLLENQRYRFTYDRRGNLQTKTDKPNQETTYYRFNLLNQLTEVITKDRDHRTIKTFRYEYDALNRRIMKQEDNQTYYYLYDGLNIIAILSETKQVLATIVHHDTKIDTPLSIHTIHGIFYYHRDHQGSIIALSDEYGDIVETIQYDDHYGTITKHWIREDIKTLNPFGYTGREMDRHDLYYYRARYYDPTAQRFLSLDPIGFAAGDFNFYRYVSNNPLRFRDPLGLEELLTGAGSLDFGQDNHVTMPSSTDIAREMRIDDKLANIDNDLYTRQTTAWAQDPTREDVASVLDVQGLSSVDKLLAVNFNNAFQAKGGTQANWGAFIYMGMFDIRDDALSDKFAKGTWIENCKRDDAKHLNKQVSDKNMLYQVEDPRFMEDIQSRKPYQDGVERVKEKLSTLSPDEVNAFLESEENNFPANFSFDGPQTAAENQYGDLEWDLGTYETNIHVEDYDPVTGEVQVSVTTTNEFHLSSLTRVNKDAQNTYGLPKSILVDREPGEPMPLQNQAVIGGLVTVATINPIAGVTAGVGSSSVGGTSYDVEFTGSDTFNIND